MRPSASITVRAGACELVLRKWVLLQWVLRLLKGPSAARCDPHKALGQGQPIAIQPRLHCTHTRRSALWLQWFDVESGTAATGDMPVTRGP